MRTTTGTEERAAETGSPVYPPYFVDLYVRSGGQRFGLTFQGFATILREVSDRYLSPDASQAESAELHRSLRLEDLVLARACASGNELAWECFLNKYRQKLYETAAAIAKEESAARELADGLYAELFGVREAGDGQRISKLGSYMGRGSLEGWLRTVLAQAYVNRFRRQRRLVSFDERSEAGEQFEAKPTAPLPVDARLERAVDESLSELSADERLLLASCDMRDSINWARLLAFVTGRVNQELLLQNEYLGAENRILRAHLPSRLQLSDPERCTLAEIGKRLGRKRLKQVECHGPAGCADAVPHWPPNRIAGVQSCVPNTDSQALPRTSHCIASTTRISHIAQAVGRLAGPGTRVIPPAT